VTVSYFEWEQNLAGEHWTEEEVNKKLLEKMNAAAHGVFDKAKEYKTDMRQGAFILALEKIKAAM
jgi:glutamate dehydrogenase (NAD(P)+)